MDSSDTGVITGVPGRVGGAGSVIVDMFLDKPCSFVPLLPQHDRAASIETGDVERSSCRYRCLSWQWSRLICWT
jgi:hypothetical protein